MVPICFPAWFMFLILFFVWPSMLVNALFSGKVFPPSLVIGLLIGFFVNTLLLFFIGLILDKKFHLKPRLRLSYKYLLPAASFVIYAVFIIFGIIFPGCH